MHPKLKRHVGFGPFDAAIVPEGDACKRISGVVTLCRAMFM